MLASEEWGATHHLNFQQGIAAALSEDPSAARNDLATAIRLYQKDGADWRFEYIKRAEDLLAAMNQGREKALLAEWYASNKKAHGIK